MGEVKPITRRGKRPTTTQKRRAPVTKRVAFIPTQDGDILLVEHETYYRMILQKPVVVTVEEDAVSYQPAPD